MTLDDLKRVFQTYFKQFLNPTNRITVLIYPSVGAIQDEEFLQLFDNDENVKGFPIRFRKITLEVLSSKSKD